MSDPERTALEHHEMVSLYQDAGTVEIELFNAASGEAETILVNHGGEGRTRTNLRARLRRNGYDLVKLDE